MKRPLPPVIVSFPARAFFKSVRSSDLDEVLPAATNEVAGTLMP
jgi:hypothetical protein